MRGVLGGRFHRGQQVRSRSRLGTGVADADLTRGPRAHALAVWLAAAAILGTAIVLERWSREPLDDPNPAYQRPGIVRPAQNSPAAPVTGLDVPNAGRPGVVFFVRERGAGELRRRLREWQWPQDVDITVLVDDRSLSRRYGLRTPGDGGPPVGYAVVDAGGRVRYATLDPYPGRHLFEVGTILEAL
jgi:hypothetical protein